MDRRATFGYNFQCNRWVYSLENEIGYIHLERSKVQPNSPLFATVGTAQIGKWYDVLALRGGYVCDCTLLYLKGGVGFTRIWGEVNDALIASLVSSTSASHRSTTAIAWVLGAGLEYAICWDWTVKAEYLYLGINDNATSHFSGTALTTNSWRHHFHGAHTFKVGVNYRFCL